MVSTDGWLWIFRAGVGFLLLAALLFLLGFATDHWHDDKSVHYGLWESCDGARCSTLKSDDLPAYHIATQAFQTMAVIFFGLSPIVHFFVYCCKTRKDTGWRSRILDIGYSAGILLHLCSLLIFGLENSTPEHFSWSYGMSCAASPIAFFGIIMIIISRKKALYKFSFRSVSRSKRKTAASESTVVERSFDYTSSRLNPYHQQEHVVSSTSEQSHSRRVPDTNVNININLNANPSSYTSEHRPDHHQQHNIHPSISAHVQQTQDSKIDFPPIVPVDNHRLHPKPSDTLVDHPLTQVRPAPKSSIAPYVSPTHKKVFGPAERRRTLELIDNNNIAPFSGGYDTPSELTPSAPPCDEPDLERDNPPPSYFEAVNGSNTLS